MDTQTSAPPPKQQVFISYAHEDEASVSVRLLLYLAEELKSDYEVFTDRSIQGSQQWSKEITQHLAACDCFVVLISEAALDSDGVLAEVERANRRFKKEKRPHIFAVHLSDKELDYQWSTCLGKHQSLPFTTGADFSIVRNWILGSITSAAAEEQIRDAAKARRRRALISIGLPAVLLLAALLVYFFALAPLSSIRRLRSASPANGLPGTPVISLSEAKNARRTGRVGWPSRADAADAAYAQFLGRWSDAHLAKATKLMNQGEVAKGFVLAALVAQENGGKLDDSFSTDYKIGHYASLKRTLRSGSPLGAGLAVSPDGMQIAAGNALWNLAANTLCSLRAGAVNAVAFGPLGLYTGGDDQFAQWTGCRRVSQFTVKAVRDQNRVLDDDLEDRVQYLAVSLDDTVATVMHNGSSVRLQKGGARFEFPLKHDAPVRSVAFSDDGSFLVTTSGETLNVWKRNIWNRPSPNPLKINARLPLRGAALNGDYVVVNALKNVKIWRLRLPKAQLVREVALPWSVRSVALSRNVSDQSILMAMVSEVGVFTDQVARNAAPDSADDALNNIGARQAVASDVIFYDRNRELIVKRLDAVEIWDAYTTLEEGSPDGRLERWMNQFALTVDENGRFEARLWPAGH